MECNGARRRLKELVHEPSGSTAGRKDMIVLRHLGTHGHHCASSCNVDAQCFCRHIGMHTIHLLHDIRLLQEEDPVTQIKSANLVLHALARLCIHAHNHHPCKEPPPLTEGVPCIEDAITLDLVRHALLPLHLITHSRLESTCQSNVHSLCRTPPLEEEDGVSRP